MNETVDDVLKNSWLVSERSQGIEAGDSKSPRQKMKELSTKSKILVSKIMLKKEQWTEQSGSMLHIKCKYDKITKALKFQTKTQNSKTVAVLESVPTGYPQNVKILSVK